MTTVLYYIGKGNALIGVPARDLTDADLKEFEKEWTLENLINSGLYKKSDEKPKIIKSKTDKESE